MAMSASHVLSAGTIAGAGALRSSGRAASAAAEMRTLALGQANSFVPQRDVVLRVSQGAAWVTLGLGMSNEAGQKAGDVVLQAGQTLQLKAGQSVVLEGKGVLRSHMRVVCADGDGETTSGTFSPTLGVAIALARVPASCGDTCEVDIRGKLHPAKVVKPVFARNGKSVL